MSSRRKRFKLRAYDYMAGHAIVAAVLKEQGEPLHLTSTEMDMVNVAVEVCADFKTKPEQADAQLRAVAAEIIRARKQTLFPVYDERDNMGDETIIPERVA